MLKSQVFNCQNLNFCPVQYLFIYPGFSFLCANLQKQLHEHDAYSFIYVTKTVRIYNSSAFFVLYSPYQQLSVTFCFVVCLNRH